MANIIAIVLFINLGRWYIGSITASIFYVVAVNSTLIEAVNRFASALTLT